VACIKALGQLGALEQYDRVDSLNGLVVCLQKLFQDYDQKLVLVLDGIDRQRGASPTLLPALARLGDTVRDSYLLLHFFAIC
jgi:origin recognition complex subunit 5